MRVVTADFQDWQWSGVLNLYPLFDVHIGPKACDEELLDRTIAKIKADPLARWISGGDACDFVNVGDRRRFTASGLAPWIDVADLSDLARAQSRRWLEKFTPIADKCLAMVKGNHEDDLAKYYERDVHSVLVNGIKDAAGWGPERKIDVGWDGWLVLHFHLGSNARVIKVRLHHGYGGGRLAGAPALEMERFLTRNDCHVALMGHNHTRHVADPVVIDRLDKAERPTVQVRRGAYCGTFLRTRVEDHDTYAVVKGYYSKDTGCPLVKIRPHADRPEDVVRIES